jgi:hypothetical protein
MKHAIAPADRPAIRKRIARSAAASRALTRRTR